MEQLERRLGEGAKGWVLERRSQSGRGRTMLDGILLLEAGSSLRMDPVRRLDADHRVLLNEQEGKPPAEADVLKERIEDARREQVVEYRLTGLSSPGPAAYLYVPRGAWVSVTARKEGLLIQLQLPWEREEEGESLNKTVMHFSS